MAVPPSRRLTLTLPNADAKFELLARAKVLQISVSQLILWAVESRTVRPQLDVPPELRKKWRANAQVSDAVVSGRLQRPAECEACGKLCRPHGHHDDYDQPLLVRWLCAPCHKRQHPKRSSMIGLEPTMKEKEG